MKNESEYCSILVWFLDHVCMKHMWLTMSICIFRGSSLLFCLVIFNFIYMIQNRSKKTWVNDMWNVINFELVCWLHYFYWLSCCDVSFIHVRWYYSYIHFSIATNLFIYFHQIVITTIGELHIKDVFVRLYFAMKEANVESLSEYIVQWILLYLHF